MAFVVECRPLNGRQLFFSALISIFMVVSIVPTPKAKLEKKVQESRILTMTSCVPVLAHFHFFEKAGVFVFERIS